MSEQRKLQPMFLVAPGSISVKDKRRAERLCGICIVECKDTASAKYSDVPMGADLDDQARAALTLMRFVVTTPQANFTRAEIIKWFVEELTNWRTPEKVGKVLAK